MDRRGVGRARDQPVEGIDLADQMALAEPADAGLHDIAPILRGVERHQRDARAAPRGRRSRLDAGMAAADHDDIERAHARRG